MMGPENLSMNQRGVTGDFYNKGFEPVWAKREDHVLLYNMEPLCADGLVTNSYAYVQCLAVSIKQ